MDEDQDECQDRGQYGGQEGVPKAGNLVQRHGFDRVDCFVHVSLVLRRAVAEPLPLHVIN